MAVTTVVSIGFNRWAILGHCTHADGRRVKRRHAYRRQTATQKLDELAATVEELMAESASRAIKPAFDVVDLDRNTVAVPFEKLRMFTVRDLKVRGNFTPSVQGLSLGLLLTLLTNRLPQDGASACVLVQFRDADSIRVPWRQPTNEPGKAACVVVRQDQTWLEPSKVSIFLESEKDGRSSMMSEIKRLTVCA